MSKVIVASCVNGVVTADGKPVAGANIHSEGVASSSGVLLLTAGRSDYIAKTSGDLKDVIGSLVSILNNVVTVLTAHDSSLGSTQTATILAITTAVTQLNTTKESLK